VFHFLAVLGIIILALAIVFVVYVIADAADRAATWVNNKFIEWYLRWYGSGL
jgi:hypothetical protein